MTAISLSDAKKQMETKKPQVIILPLNYKNSSKCFEYVEFLKSSEQTKEIQIIVTGTRRELEEESEKINNLNLLTLAKSITTPNLRETLSIAISAANSVKANIIQIKAGEHLFKEGDESDSIFILKSGELLVYKEKGDKIIELAEINQQQMIGEMALIDRSLRSASIKATRDSEVFELKLGKVDQYISEQPYWMKMLIQTLSERLRESNKKLLQKQ